MRMLEKISSLFVFLMFVSMSSIAQDENFTDDEGEVVEGEFLISKELEITLPSAQRIFEKVSPDVINSRTTEPLQYTFMDYTPAISDIQTKLRVLKLKDEKITSKPGSYLNLGFGNFLTPYLEAGLNSGVNKSGNYGVKLYHLSSRNGAIDKENSGDSHSKVDLFGKYVGGSASIGGNLSYSRDGYHFYGYEPGIEVDRDTIQQTFNDINLDFEIKSSDLGAPIDYTVYGKFHNISDKYNASELGIKVGLAGAYTINENMEAKLGLDYLYAAYKNPETINRSLVRVYPAFVYRNFGLTFDVGMKILNHNDTVNNENNTQIYPSILASYDLTDNITAYGVLEGDVEEVTFKTIANENPFVIDNLPVNHINKSLDFQLGLRGNLVQYLAFDIGVRSAIYKNMYFYVNDPLETNKFNIVFDEGNTSLFQGLLSLSYFKNRTIGTTLSMRFNAYNTGDIDKAWHKPKFELDYSLWYNLYDKVKFTADIFVLSGIEAPDIRTDPITSTTLSSAVDLNLKVDYLLSEKYGVFVSVNNLLNNNYQIYNNYPSRGLLAMLGISVSF